MPYNILDSCRYLLRWFVVSYKVIRYLDGGSGGRIGANTPPDEIIDPVRVQGLLDHLEHDAEDRTPEAGYRES